MKELKDKILNEGIIIMPNILKVDNLINHQLDINLLLNIGKEFKEYFKNEEITKIITIEAGGIAIACLSAISFNNIPVIYAKKEDSKILNTDVYQTEVHSFTKGKTYNIKISKDFLNSEDRILIIDDFLANGQAILGLNRIIKMANATLIGAGIVIEKGFQNGRSLLEEEGIDVKSLAIIEKFENGKIYFK